MKEVKSISVTKEGGIKTIRCPYCDHWIDATPVEQSNDGWISVEERLPHERVEAVLVFNGDAPLYNQCVKQATWFSRSLRFKRDSEEGFLGTITHWMPLPPAPTKQ